MSNIVVICAATVIALVIGAFGLGKVMYERGYVHGFEDGADMEAVEFTLDEEDKSEE